MPEKCACSHSKLFAVGSRQLDQHLSYMEKGTNEVFPKVIAKFRCHLLFRLQIKNLECWLLENVVDVLDQVVKSLISSQQG